MTTTNNDVPTPMLPKCQCCRCPDVCQCADDEGNNNQNERGREGTHFFSVFVFFVLHPHHNNNHSNYNICASFPNLVIPTPPTTICPSTIVPPNRFECRRRFYFSFSISAFPFPLLLFLPFAFALHPSFVLHGTGLAIGLAPALLGLALPACLAFFLWTSFLFCFASPPASPPRLINMPPLPPIRPQVHMCSTSHFLHILLHSRVILPPRELFFFNLSFFFLFSIFKLARFTRITAYSFPLLLPPIFGTF